MHLHVDMCNLFLSPPPTLRRSKRRESRIKKKSLGYLLFFEVVGEMAPFRSHFSGDQRMEKSRWQVLLRAGCSFSPALFPAAPGSPHWPFFPAVADTDAFNPCLAVVFSIKRKCTCNVLFTIPCQPSEGFCMLPCYSNKLFYIIFKMSVISCGCKD